jgi:hypothetical protein
MQVRDLQIINPDPRYGRVALVEPTTLGYLLIAAEVQPRPAPFVPTSREKAALLAQLQALAQQIEQLDSVEQATIFDAIAFAPPSAYVKERVDASRVARFDIVVLIETRSPTTARSVQTTPAYQALLDTLSSKAKRMHVIVARNAKRVGDVDKTRNGTFLFNYFVGDDPAVVLDLWDYLAGWYATETGLDNSTLLVPLEGERTDYVAINSARWDGSLLDVLRQQITKPTFRTYMLANLEANHVGAMPVIYRLAGQRARPVNRTLAIAITGAVVAGAVALGVGLGLRRRRRG